MLPLDGVTVVALEQAVAAPFATRQLADLGARVIKIERPDGGDFARGYDTTTRGMSSHFVWLNRGKESITLDLKRPGQRQVLGRLLERADVFIQNLAPGAADRLGLAPGRLREDHPRLIVCGVSGYGSSGPYRDKKAYDLLIQCESGLPSITGTADRQVKTGIPVADIAGGMYAFSGILTALYERERTGRGQALEISLFEALAEWLGYPFYYTMYGGTPPARTGLHHAALAPYGPFQAGDGGTVFLSVQNDREWTRFCETVLLRPELAADPRFRDNDARRENREDLQAVIEAVYAKLDIPTVVGRLEDAKIANARLRDLTDLAEHPQLEARERWREVDSPVGSLRALLPPITLEGRTPRMGPIPDAGQDTRAILTELGYSEMPG
jgi:itaconate CoA-transferase